MDYDSGFVFPSQHGPFALFASVVDFHFQIRTLTRAIHAGRTFGSASIGSQQNKALGQFEFFHSDVWDSIRV